MLTSGWELLDYSYVRLYAVRQVGLGVRTKLQACSCTLVLVSVLGTAGRLTHISCLIRANYFSIVTLHIQELLLNILCKIFLLCKGFRAHQSSSGFGNLNQELQAVHESLCSASLAYSLHAGLDTFLYTFI